MADLPRNSAAEIQRLRDLPYHDGYLKSSWWRRRRHVRLQKAKGKCEKCGAVTSFQDVHHVHYDRLGEERDSDLEVVCRDCHGKAHFDQSRQQNIGVYEKLARETLRLDKPTTATDFKDAFRRRLDQIHLPIDHRVDDAVSIVWKHEAVSLASEERRARVAHVLAKAGELPPISVPEGMALLRRMGYSRVPVRGMPTMFGPGTGVAFIRARAAERLKGTRCPACAHHGVQLSREPPGWVWCEHCHHKWDLLSEEVERLGFTGSSE